MRRALRLALGLGLGLVLVLAQFSVARAHAILLSAAPNPNGHFPTDAPPTQVQINFSEEVVQAFSDIQVLDAAGELMTVGHLRTNNANRTSLAVALRPLPPGSYTVAWRVLSAVDGHTSSGSFAFGVGVTPTGPTVVSPPTVSATSFINRWLGLTGLILLMGLFTFHLFVWQLSVREALLASPSADPGPAQVAGLHLARLVIRHSLWMGWIGLGLVGLGLVVALAGQRETLSGSGVPEWLGNLKVWLGTRYGGVWSMRLWLGVALAFSLADLGVGLNDAWIPAASGRAGRGDWMWWTGLALAVAAGLTASLTSHSAALPEKEALAVIADAAHVLAAGAWVGGLVQLVLATRLTRSMPLAVRQALNLRLVLNFSTMAAIAVGLLLVSGGYLAWQQVGSWAALFNTAYGQVLLAKSGLALPAFAIASLNLMVIRPQLEAARQLPGLGLAAVHRRFGRLVQMEAGFALAVVAAAGLLTDLQPGRDALLVAEQSRMTASQPADDLNVWLTIEPGQWGQFNTFDVYVLDVERQPVTDVREVSLRFSFVDRPMGTNTVTAKLVGGGHYRATGSYLSLGGRWQTEVAVRRPQAYDTYAAFELATTPEGVIRPLNASGAWDRFVTWLDGAGGWVVGGALCLLSLAWVVPAVWANAGRVTWALAVSLLPSLVAMWVGVLQIAQPMRGVPTAPSGDARALTWLAESDAAMNQLTSVRLLRTTRGESGAVLTETVRFQAPNLFHDQMSNGAENMAQGRLYFYRQPGAAQWEAVPQLTPFAFPDFDLSQQAVNARLGWRQDVEGRPTQQVLFTVYLLRDPVPFARWIDVETKLILREVMDAPGHYMVSLYHDFNAPLTIILPVASDIMPTSTLTRPAAP